VSVTRFASGELQLACRLVNSGRPRLRGLKGQTHAPAAGSVPLVFLHDVASFAYDWVPVASALGREAACLDQRGFGDSDWAGDYSAPAMAADIGALLDHLKWKKAVVVGHGLGARNALYFASRHARRVAALALVDYAPETAAPGALRAAEALAAVPDAFPSLEAAMAHFKAPREARVRFAACLLRDVGGFALKREPRGRDAARKALAAGAPARERADLCKALARLRVPALAVRGSRSELVGAEAVEKMQAACPALQVVEVSAGHNVVGENITGLVGALRGFVAGVA
jgi:pimeloyl-ACP methyl ester carboxylesterase